MAARFEAFGIPVRALASTDVVEIDAVAKEEVALLRRTRTPRVLLLHTYRLCHHSKNDDNRPADEVAKHYATEPLAVHGRRLSEDDRRRIEREVDAAIAELVAEAKSAS
jgi:TPP-dependent pyruvate/acetoin dehydrogenase alpha subunit